MSSQDLEKKKLRSLELGLTFHVKDLLGLGVFESVSTEKGTLIKLVSDKLQF